MDIKISIIVPVYNCEKYLEDCIQSLLNQTIKECEFIFINDGSTDKSYHILNKYERVDKRIVVLNEDNQGVSVARNIGIEAATGEYIGFVDGDDWIDLNMYEVLYHTAVKNNLDLVISNFEQELDGKEIINRLDIVDNLVINKEKIIADILPQFLQHDKLNTVCNKIYKRKIIIENKIRFSKAVALGEDGAFNIKFFSSAKSLMYINYTGYNYREVVGSATRNIFEKDYFKRALEVYKGEVSQIYYDNFGEDYIEKLKAIKFLENVISYTYIYFKPTNQVSFKDRYKYVKKMINNNEVNTTINKYLNIIGENKGRYERVLIKFIKMKFIFGIYLLTSYSRIRNR